MPRATYRLQLGPGFGFDQAAAVVPYLARLGVSHVYCSPVLQAAPGSAHGYDVVDHSRLSDDLGGASGFERLSLVAAGNDLSLVVDVVPNHMALSGHANHWWWDVLEDGPASQYAHYFDIDWSEDPDTTDATVLMPILGDHYGRVLEAGEFALTREGGSFSVRYHEHELPLSPRSMHDVVRAAGQRIDSDTLTAIADRFEALPPAAATDLASVRLRHAGKLAIRQDLRSLAAAQPVVADGLEAELAAVAADVDRLDALLARQNYRLAYWRVASDELDYRRFFDITTLVGLRMERQEVFDDTHERLLEFVDSGEVTGLRIDHIDGLRDPEGYLARLRSRVPGAWVVVEKILAPDEALPPAWPVAGTTGYEFAVAVGDALVDPRGAAVLVEAYHRWTGDERPFDEVAREAKHTVMDHELAAEVERVTDLLVRLCRERRRHRDHTRRDLRRVICEIAASMGVYRTYGLTGHEPRLTAAIDDVAARHPDADPELLALLRAMLSGRTDGEGLEAELALRFQQLTAPVMAKGVEDTAFYRWVPLLARNDVGGDPGVPARGPDALHARNAAAAAAHPATMLTLSTHDSKRSADVRARLNVLTEIADAWVAAVSSWLVWDDDPIMEIAFLQTLVGAWPADADRIEATMQKAAKEAKLRTSWRHRDPAYEAASGGRVRARLADVRWMDEVARFLADHQVIERGRTGSLVQVTLELTSPGVPDIYQGDEIWNLTLVDPDNRRPVDFAAREKLLDTVVDLEPPEVLGRGDEGAAKLWLVHRLLQHRRGAPHLYEATQYATLPVIGQKTNEVISFARDGLAVVVPARTDLAALQSAGAAVILPAGRWRDVLTGAVRSGAMSVADAWSRFPVSVLERVEP